MAKPSTKTTTTTTPTTSQPATSQPAPLQYYTTKARPMPLPGARVTGSVAAMWPVPMALASAATTPAGAAALPYKGTWCGTLGRVLLGGANGTMQAAPAGKALPQGSVPYTHACAMQAWAAVVHPASGVTPAALANLQAWAATHAPTLLAAPSQQATG